MTKWYLHQERQVFEASDADPRDRAKKQGGRRMGKAMVSTVEPDAASIRGPYRPSELLGMVRDGTIMPDTMLRKDDSAWFPAVSVGGLFEAAEQPTIRYLCPSCGASVKRPPCVCPRCLEEFSFLKPVIETHQLPASPNDGRDESENSRNRWLSRLKRKAKK